MVQPCSGAMKRSALGKTMPFIPGHEFLGHIVKLGANVNNFSLGERITTGSDRSLRGMPFLQKRKVLDVCQPHSIFGFQGTNNGGMAEYVKVSEDLRHLQSS